MQTYILKKSNITHLNSYLTAESIFIQLQEFIMAKEVSSEIKDTHKHGATSTAIQNILTPKLIELGFSSEKKGLFDQYPVPNLRPDFYLKLTQNEGIIIEIERGKTLDNNMDLLDIWKCHLCKEANYLFLIIPEVKLNQENKTRKIFDRSLNRLMPFFESDNYINVDAIFMIGY